MTDREFRVWETSRALATAIDEGELKMSKVTSPAIVPNATSVSMANFYEGALVAAGIDPASLSFAQIVDVTRQLHPAWQSDPARKAERDAARAEKEAEQAKAREAREEKKRQRLEEQKAKLAAQLAKLGATE